MVTVPQSACSFLKDRLGKLPHQEALESYQTWWEGEGRDISAAVDRAGTPWLRMFDVLGRRVDEVMFGPDYRRMLLTGYRTGAVWPASVHGSLVMPYLVGYVTSFFDPGLYCPHTVSLATAVAVDKYAAPEVRSRYLPRLMARDESVWQGATWMTEAKGGSDLGAAVETVARPHGDHWLLAGDKYFASNAGAELAIVAARPVGAAPGVRGLALFLVPRMRDDGSLNYTVRRIKDKIGTRSVPTGEVELRDAVGYLLGQPERGIYLILEALNLSRVANSIASVALSQRALADAFAFARQRTAFGKPIADHPLLARQFGDRLGELERGFALAWEALVLLDEAWREQPPYSPRYHLARLLIHLAKYWTAEIAVKIAAWGMEVHGGMGVLAEFGAERWLREAMIVAIWEGPAHRQILDGMEVIERKGVHRPLLDGLRGAADPAELTAIEARLEAWRARSAAQREADSEEVFADLARFTADALHRRGPAPPEQRRG